MSRSTCMLLMLIGLAAAAPAQHPAAVKEISIDLSNFKITPADIALERGITYRLHFHNDAKGGHDFAASEFFADAVAPRDAGMLDHGGAIELRGGESKDVIVTPRTAGVFKSHCAHFTHSAMGMTGTITVS